MRPLLPNSEAFGLNNMVPVQLRGHHFLCMLTFRGLGYSPEFTANMQDKINRIKDGALVGLIEGPDDICAGISKACRHATGHDCTAGDILAMDNVARVAVEAVLERDLGKAAAVTVLEIAKLRTGFSSRIIRGACDGCSWFEICTHISSTNYAGTTLPVSQS